MPKPTTDIKSRIFKAEKKVLWAAIHNCSKENLAVLTELLDALKDDKKLS